ncbi:hypothetical protein B6U81_05585 [Thermoplasmatales archaeon ex4484_30]|nr:MAG: rhomboid family intramembrane serine protease [Thermoplasmata archaeon]OYT59753.1 MAG: hypothetical protein B6U81_05585 [Thermoplasmatales archaeon ex4484_30]
MLAKIISIAVPLAIVLPIVYGFIRKIPLSLMLILSNFIVFFITFPFLKLAINEFAFNPLYLSSLTKIYTIFTSMFLHGGFDHILFNMIGLFFIGLPFENEVGTKKFITIYFISGISAALLFSFYNFGETYLIGASGAIFGILGAFAACCPFKRVFVPVPMFIMFFMRIPVIVLALLYAGLETFYTLLGAPDGVAHSAHLGGFIAGVFMYPFIKRKVEARTDININDLEELIVNDKQREIFDKVKQADEADVRDAWLSYLLKHVKCPKCGGEISVKEGIKCKKCGYKK